MVHGWGIYTAKNKKTARVYKKHAKSKGLPSYQYEVDIPFIDVRPCVWYTQVTGCVGSSVRRSGTGTGCLRGTLRLSGTKLILDIIWTCVTHVRYLYRGWAFFIFWYTCFTGCVGLNIQRGDTITGCPHWIFRLTGFCRRMYVGFFSSSCRLYSEGTGSMVYYHYDMQMRR